MHEPETVPIDALDCAVGELFGNVHPGSAEVIGSVVGLGAEAAGGDAVGGAVLFDCVFYGVGF